MPSIPPRVTAPLSECSSSVEVQGMFTGSLVRIYSGDRMVAEGTASRSRQTFSLLPGERLNRSEEVVASQKVMGEPESPRSLEPVIVQAQPATLGRVAFSSENNQCGGCIWIHGAVPGARVKISELSTGEVRGKGDAPHGVARFGLSPTNRAGEVLVAQQEACGNMGEETPAASTRMLIGNVILPRPIIMDPLKECMRTVTVANVVVGARLTLERDSGHTYSACFDANILMFIVDPPLMYGETITARQEFPDCEVDIRPAESEPRSVDRFEPVPVPIISGTICRDATSILVLNLMPFARFKVFKGTEVIGEGEAPDTNSFLIPLREPVSEGVITVRQELCGTWSDSSNEVSVTAHSDPLPNPVIPERLYACGGVVHVENVQPGAWVYVWSRNLQAPIGQMFALTNAVDVPVTPLLIVDDEIYVRILGCGRKIQESLSVRVNEMVQELSAPTIIQPIFENSRIISVSNVIPGAFVDVFVNGVWREGSFIGRPTGSISLIEILRVSNNVFIRQRLCSAVSGESSRIVVLPIPPVAAFSASATSGIVPFTVNFTNRSTGVVTELEWDFGDDSMLDHTMNPSHTYTSPDSYHVTLRAIGPSGRRHSTTASATVTARYPVPVAAFTPVPNSGTAPLPVNFMNTSTGMIERYEWDFNGDGRSDPITSSTPSFTYNAGIYDARLTVHGPGGTNSTTRRITVNAPPADLAITIAISAPIISIESSRGEIRIPGLPPQMWSFGRGGSGTIRLVRQPVFGERWSIWASVGFRYRVADPSSMQFDEVVDAMVTNESAPRIVVGPVPHVNFAVAERVSSSSRYFEIS